MKKILLMALALLLPVVSQAQVLKPVVKLELDPQIEWRRLGEVVTARWSIRRAGNCVLSSSVPASDYLLPAAPGADGSQTMTLQHTGMYGYRLTCDGNDGVTYVVLKDFRVTDGSEVGTRPPQAESYFIFASDVFVGNPGVPVADLRFGVAVSGELIWSFPYAASCVASSDGQAALYQPWSGVLDTRGRQRISFVRPLGPLSAEYAYTLRCSNALGTDERSVKPR